VEFKAQAGSQAFATDEGFPGVWVVAVEEEEFYFAAGLCLVAEQASGDDAGLVEDEQVAGAQVLADVVEGAVFKCACLAADDHQPRGVTGFGGRLGNQFGGKLVVKVAGFHTSWHFAYPLQCLVLYTKSEPATSSMACCREQPDVIRWVGDLMGQPDDFVQVYELVTALFAPD
jgi:hypothetical protein